MDAPIPMRVWKQNAWVQTVKVRLARDAGLMTL